MAKQKREQTKRPQANAGKNSGSEARKRSERQPKAAGKGASSKPAQEPKSSDVKKIYKTTDGYFNGRSDIKKPRNVAVVAQREDDGALAVVKIYSKKGKKRKSYIKRLVLKPKKHSALTEKSLVGKQVFIGVKTKTAKGEVYKPIFKGDMIATDDKLTDREIKKVKRGAGGTSKKNKQTLKNKLEKWLNHFRK